MKLMQVFLVVFLLAVGFETTASQNTNSATPTNFPLKIHPNGKHLTDTNGKPFLMVADVAWQMLRKLSYVEAVNYMDIRKSQSFNTFIVQLLPALPNQKNFSKASPFDNNNNITNPNKAYFDYLEKIVIAAKERSLVVGIVVSRKSWNAIFDTFKEQDWKEYGAYVGKKFAKYSNVIWIVSEEEYQSAAQFKAISDGLKSTKDEQLIASLSTCTPTNSIASSANRSDMKFVIPDSTVTYTEYATLANWQKNSGALSLQPFLIANSEFPKEITDQSVLIRNQAYQSIMSSAAGFCHMSTIKNFNPTWKGNITKDGAEYITHFVKILKGIPWEYMYPDDALGLLPDSTDQKEIGVFSLSNHKMAMMYIPMSKSVLLDLTQLQGKEFRFVWYSPRTGKRWNGGDMSISNEAVINPPDPQIGWDWILLVGTKN